MLCRKATKCLIGIFLLYAACLFNSCQQPGLNAGEDDIAQADPPAQTPQAKQGTQVLTTPESPGTGLVMTSSSDSSPDTKEVAVASREIGAKRPPARQPSEEEAQLIATKRAKKETTFPNHKEWFTSFTQAVAQVEQDLKNKAAWDVVEEVLIEGKKNDFLERSIICPNDSNPDTEYEYTPLHYAASRGILSLVKELVVYEKVPVDLQTTNKQNTPLHLAAARGHLDIVQFLVEEGASLALTDRKKGNALHYAVSGMKGEMSRDIIEYLVSKGSNFLELASNNSSPLSTAVFAGNLPVIEYWEDNYRSNLDIRVDEITQRALKIAKYRRKHIYPERLIQTDIVRILENFMENRKDKNKDFAK